MTALNPSSKSLTPGPALPRLPRIIRNTLYALILSLPVLLLTPVAATSAQAQEAEAAVQVRTINVNTADAQTLADVLQGVGLSRAEEIIRYREAYGPFKTIDELIDVKGIGPATLDKNRTFITLE